MGRRKKGGKERKKNGMLGYSRSRGSAAVTILDWKMIVKYTDAVLCGGVGSDLSYGLH